MSWDLEMEAHVSSLWIEYVQLHDDGVAVAVAVALADVAVNSAMVAVSGYPVALQLDMADVYASSAPLSAKRGELAWNWSDLSTQSEQPPEPSSPPYVSVSTKLL